MTGEERLDFRDLRKEVRDGFETVATAISAIGDRVTKIEMERAVEKALNEREAADTTGRSANRRWRIGVILTASGAAAAGIADLALRILRIS